jgi:hypothetical protein
LKGFFPAR